MSSSIRQRLLEIYELTFRNVIRQANSLELAQENSQAYNVSGYLTCRVAAVTEKVRLAYQS